MVLIESLLKIILRPDRWKYDSIGYCPSCDRKTMFLLSLHMQNHLLKLISCWKSSPAFKETLLQRENILCGICNANFRMRALADTVLKLLNMSQTSELANRLWKQRDFFVYETAAHLVFRADTLKAVNNYVVSEFFEDQPAGALVHTMRNENLEQLTFADNTFDILISSDVLEHVGNIEKALSEIKRVVKPGGFHVFTVPVDNELPKTRERARISRGNVEYLLEPVRHSDSLREEGILVFRDFGKDIIDYMSRDGFMCQEVVYEKNGMPITSVFYAKKNVNE